MHPLIASSIPTNPSIFETLGFQLNGLIVVFTALCSIWAATAAIGFFFKRSAAKKVGALHVDTQLSSEPEDLSDDLPPEIIAAITSAIAVTVERRFRIHSVVVEEQPKDWAREGRRMIFASHKIR